MIDVEKIKEEEEIDDDKVPNEVVPNLEDEDDDSFVFKIKNLDTGEE